MQKFTKWQVAVLDGLHRYSVRHRTRLIPRSQLIQEELEAIGRQVGTQGVTPKNTLSRVLQEFRKMGLLNHVERGIDLLLDSPIVADDEDYPDTALDIAIHKEELIINDYPTGDITILSRRRKGQARLRKLTMANYHEQCGLCDVREQDLLVASHILRWADNAESRGKLSNILCLCKMHDALFECGHISLTDQLSVLLMGGTTSATIKYLQSTAKRLRSPANHHPAPEFLKAHRIRTGFEEI